jgi:apolipoprotein N-acyltransferase
MYKPVFVAIFAGAITAAAVHIPLLWWLSIFGLILFLKTLKSNEGSLALPVGMAYGLTYTGASLYEFWESLPFSAVGISFPFDLLIVGMSWTILTGVLGMTLGIAGFLYVRFAPSRVIERALFVASLVTLLQYLQMWLYALLMTDGIAPLEAHLSSSMIGYSLVHVSILLQLASIGGIYLLTWSTVCIAVLVFEYSKRSPPTPHTVAMSILLVSSAICVSLFDATTYFPLHNASKPELRVALVTTYFPPNPARGDASVHTQLDSAIRDWEKTNVAPDIMIFPESEGFFHYSRLDPPQFSKEVFSHDVEFIDSRISSSTHEKIVVLYGKEGEETSGKRFLAPLGEYTPLFALAATAPISTHTTSHRGLDLKAGESSILRSEKASIGALFCSEVLSPTLYRTLTRDGAELLVNISSHAWFNDSPIVDARVTTIGRVRAVENDRYLLIARDHGRSTIISNRGRIEAQSKVGTHIISASVPLLRTKTIYTQIQEYILLIPLCMLAWFCFVAYRKRNRT